MLQGGPEASASQAEFSGHLDITALGGAGFASQRTADDVPGWDVSGYDVLVLDVARADTRKYTLTLKDEVLPRRPDGRDQSTVSWEYDFVVGAGEDAAAASAAGSTTGSTRVVIPFGDFQPTYRGKSKPDAAPLDLKNVKRISFMMRRSVPSARVPIRLQHPRPRTHYFGETQLTCDTIPVSLVIKRVTFPSSSTRWP